MKPLIAQLMRIHIVTPKAPIHVTLNPRVQPAPSPCPIFVTGCEQPMKLSQSAYWVLRLPYPFSIQNVLQTLLTSLYCLNRDTCSKAIHLCFILGGDTIIIIIIIIITFKFIHTSWILGCSLLLSPSQQEIKVIYPSSL